MKFLKRLFGKKDTVEKRGSGLREVSPSSEIQTCAVDSYQRQQDQSECPEIDLTSMAYVPLPRSPSRWEETKAGKSYQEVPKPKNFFEVREADWCVESIRTIPQPERSDPAFRRMFPTESGLVMVDDLGKASDLGKIEAAALRYDRQGNLVAKDRLSYGVYRVGVHPRGRQLIAMSRDCIIHAYDENLGLRLEVPLDLTPEIRAFRRRFQIPGGQLKNHIRCVALSQNADHYLFTAVDQAWCKDMSGETIWRVKLPVKEGWARAATPSDTFSTSSEVDDALGAIDMSLPFTPEDLKQRYRELSKRWHPDLNPGDPRAEERMKAINSAVEILTGLDKTVLPSYADAMFTRELSRDVFEVAGTTVTLTIDLQMGERWACDWIYAAAFSTNSNAAYLAGYSGRVLLVDENGKGIRVYDIGGVPRRIVDTGEFLYLLTDTRLYVLRDDALHALIDTFEGGDLVVAETGFGLLEKKRLRWFRSDGLFLGSVVSKNPIRRVYSTEQATVVETRQRRATIHGFPEWWK